MNFSDSQFYARWSQISTSWSLNRVSQVGPYWASANEILVPFTPHGLSNKSTLFSWNWSFYPSLVPCFLSSGSWKCPRQSDFSCNSTTFNPRSTYISDHFNPMSINIYDCVITDNTSTLWSHGSNEVLTAWLLCTDKKPRANNQPGFSPLTKCSPRVGLTRGSDRLRFRWSQL